MVAACSCPISASRAGMPAGSSMRLRRAPQGIHVTRLSELSLCSQVCALRVHLVDASRAIREDGVGHSRPFRREMWVRCFIQARRNCVILTPNTIPKPSSTPEHLILALSGSFQWSRTRSRVAVMATTTATRLRRVASAAQRSPCSKPTATPSRRRWTITLVAVAWVRACCPDSKPNPSSPFTLTLAPIPQPSNPDP